MFAEQVDSLTAKHARWTSLCRKALEHIGSALAGRAGAAWPRRPRSPGSWPRSVRRATPAAPRTQTRARHKVRVEVGAGEVGAGEVGAASQAVYASPGLACGAGAEVDLGGLLDTAITCGRGRRNAGLGSGCRGSSRAPVQRYAISVVFRSRANDEGRVAAGRTRAIPFLVQQRARNATSTRPPFSRWP